MRSTAVFVIFILVLVGVVGYAWQQQRKYPPQRPEYRSSAIPPATTVQPTVTSARADWVTYVNAAYGLQVRYPAQFRVEFWDGEGVVTPYKGGVARRRHSSVMFGSDETFLKEHCNETADSYKVWINMVSSGGVLSETEKETLTLTDLFKKYPEQLAYYGPTDNITHDQRGSGEILLLNYGTPPTLKSVVIKTPAGDFLEMSVADNGLCPAIYSVFEQMVETLVLETPEH